MHVDELVWLANSDEPPPLPQVRDQIKEINSLGPSRDSLTNLRLLNILPVKGTDGQVNLGIPRIFLPSSIVSNTGICLERRYRCSTLALTRYTNYDPSFLLSNWIADT